MRVRFFGVRGSVPYATSASMGHGCNTPCVEVFDDGAFAYRIRGAGGTLVYATDHEFGDPAIDEALAAFAAGASAVILDFTPDELPAHKGWGHGDWSQCAQFASACGRESVAFPSQAGAHRRGIESDRSRDTSSVCRNRCRERRRHLHGLTTINAVTVEDSNGRARRSRLCYRMA
jgi:hypothetical protein